MELWILLGALVTSTISGALAMAGGVILIGVYTVLLPVQSAMVLHGITQVSSNFWRVCLYRKHIVWSILGPYLVGAFAAFGLLMAMNFLPSKAQIFLFIGLFSLGSFMVPSHPLLSIEKMPIAVACGFIVTGLQIVAGVAGPALDLFYVQSPTLNRFQIIATKSLTQVIGHLLKIIYYAQLMMACQACLDFTPLLYMGLILSTFIGTGLGKKIVETLSDHQFRFICKSMIALIAVVYLLRGLSHTPYVQNLLEPSPLMTATKGQKVQKS